MNANAEVKYDSGADKLLKIVPLKETETDALYQSLTSLYEKHQRMPRLYSFLAALSNTTDQLGYMLMNYKRAFDQTEYVPKQLEIARKKTGVNDLGKKKFIIMNSTGNLGVFSGKNSNLSLSRSYHDFFNRDISDIGVIVLPKSAKGEQFKRKVYELLPALEECVKN